MVYTNHLIYYVAEWVVVFVLFLLEIKNIAILYEHSNVIFVQNDIHLLRKELASLRNDEKRKQPIRAVQRDLSVSYG